MVIEKKLSDDEVGTFIDFGFEMAPIGLFPGFAGDVAFGESGGADAEATHLADETYEFVGELEPAFGFSEFACAAGWVTAEGEDIMDSARAGVVEDGGDLVAGGIDTGQMRHRGEAEIFLDTIDDAEGFVAGCAAGAVGDGAEVRVDGHQGGQSFFEKSTLAVVGLGRKELEGHHGGLGGLTFFVDIADQTHEVGSMELGLG